MRVLQVRRGNAGGIEDQCTFLIGQRHLRPVQPTASDSTAGNDGYAAPIRPSRWLIDSITGRPYLEAMA